MAPPSGPRGMRHYHLHKAGGKTLNDIVVKRYGGKELHGGLKPPLGAALTHDGGQLAYVTWVREASDVISFLFSPLLLRCFFFFFTPARVGGAMVQQNATTSARHLMSLATT
jgi:hypothetical protein